MKTSFRLIPDWPLPPYIFVPGKNPHPKKAGGHMEGEGDPVAPPINLASPSDSSFLRYSLDLYNHGYYWEGHVYLEALWNAHGRVGSVSDFLKGLIKIGAAGVKFSIGQDVAGKAHLERAVELFTLVMEKEGRIFLGLDLDCLIHELGQGIPELRPLWA